jgi:hypothetical protein
MLREGNPAKKAEVQWSRRFRITKAGEASLRTVRFGTDDIATLEAGYRLTARTN